MRKKETDCWLEFVDLLTASKKTVIFNTVFQAAKYGFDDRNFHDFLKNPKSDEHRKLEPFGVEEMLKPFEAWKVKVDKTPY